MLFLFLLDSYFGDKSSYAENISTVNMTSPSSTKDIKISRVRKTPLSSNRPGCRNSTPFMGYSGKAVGLLHFKRNIQTK